MTASEESVAKKISEMAYRNGVMAGEEESGIGGNQWRSRRQWQLAEKRHVSIAA